MSLIINAFFIRAKKFSSKNSSKTAQTAQIHVIKLDINHLKIQECLEKKELKIDILPDKENKCISTTDTRIVMTKTQLILSLGTISRSGTRKFIQMIE
jgi:HSP90 family molecular chaperone